MDSQAYNEPMVQMNAFSKRSREQLGYPPGDHVAGGPTPTRRLAVTRTILLLYIVLLCASGCQHIAGPREARLKPKPDLPWYTIEEQERRARDKHAIPEDDWRIGPATFIDRPSPTGR
jgi:hypothetical protein